MPATFTPGDEKQEERLNPSQQDADQRFSALSGAEKRGTMDMSDYERNYQENADPTQEDKNADIAKVRRQESEGSRGVASSIPTTYTGAKNNKKKLTRAQLTRRWGLIGGGGGIIGIVLFFITGFLPLGGILLNLGEVATANRDTQNTVLSKRLFKVLDNKLVGNVTSGSCSVVQIMCRFSRPSNALLSRLDDYGIKAYVGDTEVAKTLVGFPNQRPDNYRLTKEDGSVLKVSAKDFVSTLSKDPEFNKAFTKAFNMRYWGYADSVIKSLFYKKEGIDRSGKATDNIDSKDPQKSIKNLADGADTSSVKNATTDEDIKAAATTELENELTQETQDAATKAVKTKGDPALLGATAACVMLNTPSIFAKISRAYQMRQEIVLASTLVLTAASMLKAGDMSPTTMATIGTLLTATTILANGNRSKSAMDSFGIKNVLFNDSSASKQDSSFSKFIPGKTAMDATAGISGFANSPQVKSACSAVSSPEAQVAVNAVEAGIGAATGGIGEAVKVGFQAAIGGALTIAGVQGVMNLATPVIKQVTGIIVGAISPQVITTIFGNANIENAKGEDLGNALGGGLNFFFSNAALSTGSAPLTLSQLADYNQVSQDTMLAYAQQDRTGRSPLDISSPYTFLGSIFANYYQYAYVPNNFFQTALSSIGYTLTQPLKMLTSNSYATADDLTSRCSHASDFGVDSSVAIGAYGDICAGIPAQYLDTSTLDVTNSVSDQVDPNSGQPNSDSDIQTMLNTCSNGDLLSAQGCTIDNQQRANQSLYMYDLRINNILDGVDTDKDTSTSSNNAPAAGRPAEAISAGQGWTVPNTADYSNYPCDPRTQDAGIYQNPDYGFKVRLCAVTFNTPPASPGASNLIASVISTNAMNMFEAARADGVELGISDAMRKASDPDYSSYTQHKYGLAMDLGTPRGGNTICYAGVPSTKNGWGSLSAAQAACQRIGGIQYAAYQWLNQHAATYGFYNLDVEPWHWSTSGM